MWHMKDMDHNKETGLCCSTGHDDSSTFRHCMEGGWKEASPTLLRNMAESKKYVNVGSSLYIDLEVAPKAL